MREIKFRVYNPKDNKVHYDITGFEFNNKCEMSGVFIDGDFFLKEEVELMQYTGIKDKNGKEIYEGDILQDSDCVYEVIFEYGCFDVKVIKVLKNVGTQKGLKYRTSFIVSDNDSIEIIRQ